MAIRKPWLKTRLRQLGKTSAGLARHLKVEGPRVYEVIGGRRSLQPHEIEPAAKFLEWSIEELLQRLPPHERIMTLPKVIPVAPGAGITATLGRQEIPLLDADGDTRGYLSGGFDNRSDLFCVYVSGKQMMPWRQDGQIVVGEKNRPPRENDHVVIFMTVNRQKTYKIVQLLHSDNPETIVVKQHNPDNGPEPIERRTISAIYRAVTWDDVIR